MLKYKINCSITVSSIRYSQKTKENNTCIKSNFVILIWDEVGEVAELATYLRFKSSTTDSKLKIHEDLNQ